MADTQDFNSIQNEISMKLEMDGNIILKNAILRTNKYFS